MVVLGGSPADATVHARQGPSPSPEYTVIQTIVRSSTTQVATATLAAGFPATPAPSSDGVGITRAQVEIIVGVLVGVGGFICILLCCCFRSVRRNGWSRRPRHRNSRRKRDSDGSGESPYRRPPSIANNYWDSVPLGGEDPVIRPPPPPVFPQQTGIRTQFPAPPSPPSSRSDAERSRSPSRSPPSSLSSAPPPRPQQRPQKQPAQRLQTGESAGKPDEGGKSGGKEQSPQPSQPPTQQQDGEQQSVQQTPKHQDKEEDLWQTKPAKPQDGQPEGSSRKIPKAEPGADKSRPEVSGEPPAPGPSKTKPTDGEPSKEPASSGNTKESELPGGKVPETEPSGTDSRYNKPTVDEGTNREASEGQGQDAQSPPQTIGSPATKPTSKPVVRPSSKPASSHSASPRATPRQYKITAHQKPRSESIGSQDLSQDLPSTPRSSRGTPRQHTATQNPQSRREPIDSRGSSLKLTDSPRSPRQQHWPGLVPSRRPSRHEAGAYVGPPAAATAQPPNQNGARIPGINIVDAEPPDNNTAGPPLPPAYGGFQEQTTRYLPFTMSPYPQTGPSTAIPALPREYPAGSFGAGPPGIPALPREYPAGGIGAGPPGIPALPREYPAGGIGAGPPGIPAFPREYPAGGVGAGLPAISGLHREYPDGGLGGGLPGNLGIGGGDYPPTHHHPNGMYPGTAGGFDPNGPNPPPFDGYSARVVNATPPLPPSAARGGARLAPPRDRRPARRPVARHRVFRDDEDNVSVLDDEVATQRHGRQGVRRHDFREGGDWHEEPAPGVAVPGPLKAKAGKGFQAAGIRAAMHFMAGHRNRAAP
ncbi:hypothetical protein B0T26DRAFT_228929 [Lasiosphaeria miniovina]|uniref:Uncharacterized protein n=1 Tax=Lasiosphaeria miniovina TaxID=1954250 RepID=A0AA40AVE9_9PEZI|nr:uncharacterized protein B0T26DRAFT_228929 [Lasiosphaeria miniovina]KAK0722686.1 hypothetical protein B0T26DRAFT_228929 [Lasiosphaeria miniovina]